MTGFLVQARKDPRAERAFQLSAKWASGQLTSHRVRAFSHATTVTNTLGRYVPNIPPQAVAACLLHAVPKWPQPDRAVHRLVENQCGPEAQRLLRALRAEHNSVGVPSNDAAREHLRLLRHMPWLAHTSLAFKIVTLQHTLSRPARTSRALMGQLARTDQGSQLPYLIQVHALTAGIVPQPMSDEFGRLLEQGRPVPTSTAN
ncbi:hypothetical protein [Streptomyces chartreusis]|uniref:HD domain-containing protein n=1 Tax=Streptomyces chartreusis TaxID=1969 RepID=A0A7H8TK45_STRCX|nr:hypothetical protein [Streptomyces chartreusis]QKZ23889.1 hypothetical protein HUT05_44975 [Streptomyces chartreusis]